MLALAQEKGVKPWVQEMKMSEAGKAFDALSSGSVRYRSAVLCTSPIASKR